SNPRDATGMVVDSLLSPFTWIQVLTDVPTFGVPTLLNVVNTRARADEQIESARRSALDFYVFTRDAFMQYRASANKNQAGVSDYGSDTLYEEGGKSDELYEVEPGKKE